MIRVSTDKKIKLIGTLIGIVLFIGLIAGMSYAFITWRSSNVGISGTGECFNVNYTKGQEITNESVILFDESSIINNNKITIRNGMALTDVTAYLDSACNITSDIDISLNVTNINNAFISGNSIGAFKYVVASYDPSTYSNITTTALNGTSFDILKTGSITSLGEISLVSNSLSNTKKGYLIIFYVDGDLAMNDAQNTTFTATITGTAMQTDKVTLIDHITNLYTRGNPSLIEHLKSDGTIDTYYYSYQDDTDTWGLMNDGLKLSDTYGAGLLVGGTEGNIRYFGPSDSVNNYIYFNCSDYSNQSSSTCEKWRIIGIVDGKVKIIRGSSIGDYPWSDELSEFWSTISIKDVLNEGGAYYEGLKSKNNKTIVLISESLWYLGGSSFFQPYANMGMFSNEHYIAERSENLVWSGDIALAYTSDYGFGADLKDCNDMLHEYSLNQCLSVNWLTNIFTVDDVYWLITTNDIYGYDAYYVAGGDVWYDDDSSYTPNNMYGVIPTLYLEPTLLFDGMGNGTSSNPYQLFVN